MVFTVLRELDVIEHSQCKHLFEYKPNNSDQVLLVMYCDDADAAVLIAGVIWTSVRKSWHKRQG